MTRCHAPAPTPRPRGVVLLALLLAMALAGIAALAAVDVWAVSRQHEREQQLLYAGEQYRQALRHYYYGAPAGTPRVFPDSLADLLDDTRFPVPVHHLRRLYRDPITGNAEWGELRVADRIVGVYSLSEQAPLKKAGFSGPNATALFADAVTYRDWVFAVQLQRGMQPRARPNPGATDGSTPQSSSSDARQPS
jgi:type II secretory pathway pseudopilin PulG